ncbi:hypothetical protein FH972_021569 [Carpinus fangiana]|uniref:Uncharacterized protein n=1 Tax=Carpinus fangiana TaxID=176857 RepID=A0A5N6KRV3_9ROSI|nr:hypothetical protein FH972_021569 [Carpinus fangiana]
MTDMPFCVRPRKPRPLNTTLRRLLAQKRDIIESDISFQMLYGEALDGDTFGIQSLSHVATTILPSRKEVNSLSALPLALNMMKTQSQRQAYVQVASRRQGREGTQHLICLDQSTELDHLQVIRG